MTASTSSREVVYKLRASTSRIIVHDSHTGPEIGQVEEVSRWHIEAGENAKRMGLMSIGYHFIIERDGHVVPCRDVDRIGTHAPGNNLDSIGICLVGGRMADRTDVPEDNFTGAQRKALIKLIVELRQKYGDIAICGKTEVQRYKNRALPPSPYMDMDLLRDDVKVFEQMGVIL